MSRSVSVRINPGSALDRLLNGPQGAQLGHTKRLHDIAERYEVLLSLAWNPHANIALAVNTTAEREDLADRAAANLPPRNPRSRKPARLP